MNTRLIGTFGSFPSDKEDYKKADVVIIPMGYEESTCYIPGTKFGPSAIIEASHYLEFYDIELDYNASDKKNIYTLPEPEFTYPPYTSRFTVPPLMLTELLATAPEPEYTNPP